LDKPQTNFLQAGFRALSVIEDQVVRLRTKNVKHSFGSLDFYGTLWKIRRFTEYSDDEWSKLQHSDSAKAMQFPKRESFLGADADEIKEVSKTISFIRTDLDKFDRAEQEIVINLGYASAAFQFLLYCQGFWDDLMVQIGTKASEDFHLHAPFVWPYALIMTPELILKSLHNSGSIFGVHESFSIQVQKALAAEKKGKEEEEDKNDDTGKKDKKKEKNGPSDKASSTEGAAAAPDQKQTGKQKQKDKKCDVM